MSIGADLKDTFQNFLYHKKWTVGDPDAVRRTNTVYFFFTLSVQVVMAVLTGNDKTARCGNLF